MVNEDLIPITYGAGTGGNFLCHFLISAKRNIQQLPVLSDFGNAHDGLQDFVEHWASFSSDEMETVLKKHIYTTTIKPYFGNVHLYDANLINSYFKKSIRIVYDSDDVNEIAIIFYGKWVSTPRGQRFSQRNLLKIPSLEDIITGTRIALDLFCKDDRLSNILFVSWKELFKGNVEDLIVKLSKFTNINQDNFHRESINLWREKTQYCVDTYSNMSLI